MKTQKITNSELWFHYWFYWIVFWICYSKL